jgi:hypothetical protein
MGHKVGVWIDRTRAVIVSASARRVTMKTLDSAVEEQVQDRCGQHLDWFYDQVISEMGQPKALAIFGPDDAKLHFSERLSRSKRVAATSFGLATTATLTDPQIVAKVKGHYGLRR